MPSILIVSAYFAPSGQIGGRRTEKIAGHLARCGWDVTVLTMLAKHTPPVDPSLVIPENVEIIRTTAFLPRTILRNLRRFRLRNPLRCNYAEPDHKAPRHQTTMWGRFRSALLARAENTARRMLPLFEYLDEFSGWKPFALGAVRSRSFDVVLGTLPPFSAAWIAHEAARRCGAKLVLDYRDPWCEILEKPIFGIHSWKTLQKHRRVEQMCLDHAAMILGVSPTICNWLRARTQTPVELMPQGFEPVVGTSASPSGSPTRLVYAGALTYGRALTPLFEAIALLKDTIPPQELQIVYCGPNGDIAQAGAKKVGVTEYFQNLGQVSAGRAREVMLSGTAGIVLISSGYEYAYPAKLFDILGAARRVLLIGTPQSDAAALLAQHRLGWNHSETDVRGIADTIRNTTQGAHPVPVGLEDLSVTTLMNRLNQLLFRAIGTEHVPDPAPKPDLA